MDTTIGAETAKLAGLQVDMLQKVRSGQMTLEQVKWFNGLTKDRRDELVVQSAEKKVALPRFVRLCALAKFVRRDGLVSAEAFEKCLVPRWWKQDGVIYFDVVFDGTTGLDWIPRMEKAGKYVDNYARSALLSPSFKPTKSGVYRIAVLPGDLFTDDDRVTSKIRADADGRKMQKPEADLGCVLREMFAENEIEEMGLRWLVAMHEPILVSVGNPRLLGTFDGGGLSAYYDRPDNRWNREDGFAFASQVSSFLSLFGRVFFY